MISPDEFDRWKEAEERFREGPKFFDISTVYQPADRMIWR